MSGPEPLNPKQLRLGPIRLRMVADPLDHCRFRRDLHTSAWSGSRSAPRRQTTRHVLAKELGPKKITVNVVSPGPTDTELFGQGKSEEQKQRFAQMAALGRLGQPQNIADVVALLVTEDAHWITGQNIRANGGLI